MRIAVTGTYCVGKTSVSDAIGNMRNDISVVPEAARRFFSEHPESIKQHRLYSVQHKISDLALQDLAIHHDTPHVLFDRTPLDAAAYYLSLTGDKDFARVIASGSIAKLDGIVMLSQVGVDLEDDGLRIPSLRARALFEEALDEMYRYGEIDYQVIHGSLDERIDKVQSEFPSAVSVVAV